MKRAMNTSVGISTLVLITLLTGCATERAGQHGEVRRSAPPVQDAAPAAAPPAATPPASAVAEPPALPHADVMQSPAHSSAKPVPDTLWKNTQQSPAATEVPVVPVPEIKTPPPAAAMPPVPEAKSPPAATNRPQSAARWSRELTVTQERFLERNENSLLRIYVDMSKSEVLSIMSDYSAGDWVNPCKQEQLMDSKGRIYDVVFYLSRSPMQSQPFNERLMTPVILRDDRVYAIGRYSLKKLRATSRILSSATVGCQHV